LKDSRNLRTIFLWILIGVFVFFLFKGLNEVGVRKVEKIYYSKFLQLVDKGQVTDVVIENRSIKGKYIKNNEIIYFVTEMPSDDKTLIQRLEKSGISFTGKQPSESKWWMSLLYSIFPALIFVGLFWYLINRQVRGAGNKTLSFGKSRAKLLSESKTKCTFDDVAGVEEAKQELKEIIAFLKDPKKFQRLGAKIPKGVLLVGAPGTGKTLLARAIAGEAGVPFFSISGSDFVEMFVGVGASRVRDLFEQSKKNAPCIIFIDEIDAVGRMRGAGLGGGHDEREQTLNQLLVEMDGFNSSEGIILIAATNRPDVLDPALLRPGRFDRHVVVDAPDLKGREEILRVHCKNKPLAEDVDIKVLARRTPGFVGSDIANMVNEAALLAARRNKDRITMQEMEEAIDRVIAGPERKSRLISEKERRIVAYHESGHVLIAKLLPNSDPVHKISIMPRGVGALGYTLQLPIEDRYLTTKSEIIDKLCVLLGGRVAEEVIFEDVSTGAKNDLERATEMAHKMVCEYGMSENLGLLTYGKKDEQIFLGRDLVKEKNYSEEVAAKIDMEVRRVVDECHEKTKKLILENKENLIKIAEILMEEEILSGEDIDQILKGTYQKKRDRKEKEDTEKDNEKESSTEENSPEKEVKKDQD